MSWTLNSITDCGRQFLSLKSIIFRHSFQSTNHTIHEYRSPFHFDISRSTQLPKEKEIITLPSFGQILPPSMRTSLGDARPPSEELCCRSECSVLYTVRAELVKNGFCIGKAVREVKLLPVMSSEPPTCISDFVGEFSLEAHQKLKRCMGLLNAGELSVKVTEPPPMEYTKSKPVVSTPVILKVTYRQNIRAQDVKGRKVPKTLCGKVTSAFKSTTFVSVQERKRAPTTQEAMVTPYLHKSSTVHDLHQHSLVFEPWSCGAKNTGMNACNFLG